MPSWRHMRRAVIAERDRRRAISSAELRIHEAAHTVCAEAVGVPVARVWSNANIGSCDYATRARSPDDLWRRLIVVLAGEIGVKCYTPANGNYDHLDQEKAKQIARALSILVDVDETNILDVARVQAEHIVRRHWDGIARLAAALREKGGVLSSRREILDAIGDDFVIETPSLPWKTLTVNDADGRPLGYLTVGPAAVSAFRREPDGRCGECLGRFADVGSASRAFDTKLPKRRISVTRQLVRYPAVRRH